MIDDLSNELRAALERRQVLEQKVATLTSELQERGDRNNSSQTRVVDLEREIWLAKERMSQLEYAAGENHHLHNRVGQLEHECADIAHDRDAKQNHIMFIENELRLKQQFIDEKSAALSESFVIHKEPFKDRHKWMLTMWSQLNTAHAMQRVWFELDNVHANDHRMVHMVGSFTNWELTLLVTRHDDGKWGVWVDLPVGRHEFRFQVDGHWQTSNLYARCHNDYGTENNWRNVE